MPSEVMSLALSSGIGLGVVAGIVSGVCYILAQGIQRRGRNSRRHGTWKCDVCGERFRSYDGILDPDKVVNCSRCNAKVCKATCSKKSAPAYAWICSHCQEPETWFRGILSALQPNHTIKVHDINQQNMDRVVNEVDADLEKLRNKEKEQVRDFIERLVSAMLGGELDNISVTRIYEDDKYDVLFNRYHRELSGALTDLGSAFHISIANLPVTGQSPCSAHATLKQIIQRIIREAAALPELRESASSPAQSLNSLPPRGSAENYQQNHQEESSRTYEDLLATAILNKVISSYQEELPRAGSRAGSVSSRTSRVSKPSSYTSGKEYFFGEETLDSKWSAQAAAANDDTTSVSSLEEWIRNGNDPQGRHKEQMTLTIQQRIEEATSSDEECDGDVDHLSVYSRLSNAKGVRNRKGASVANGAVPQVISTEEIPQAGDAAGDSSDAWSENWLLQRRRYNGTASPVPVPMLVPNPSVMCKVQIGDKDVDDTSDLSETGSDFGAGEPESFSSDIKSILVESKTVIGGKNVLRSLINEGAVKGVTTATKEAEKESPKKVTETQTILLDNPLERHHQIKTLTNGVQLSDATLGRGREVDDVSSSSNGPSSDFLTDGSESIEVNEARNISLLSEPYLEPSSLESNTEQDAEYTEKYATLPRTILLKSNNPVAKPRNSETSFQHKDLSSDPAEDSGIDAKENSDNHSKDQDDPSDERESESEDFVRIFKGSYSEREKKKWENPVPLANNPYSPENLDRRLSRNSSFSSTNSSAKDAEENLEPKIVCGMPPSKMSTVTRQTSLIDVFDEDRKKNKNIRFGRDYYIREATKSTGATKPGRVLASPDSDNQRQLSPGVGEPPKSAAASFENGRESSSSPEAHPGATQGDSSFNRFKDSVNDQSPAKPLSPTQLTSALEESVVDGGGAPTASIKPQPKLRTLATKRVDSPTASAIVRQTVQFLEKNEKETTKSKLSENENFENDIQLNDLQAIQLDSEESEHRIQNTSTPLKPEVSQRVKRPKDLDLADEDSDATPPPIPSTPVPTPEKNSHSFLGQTDEVLYKAFPILIEGDTVNFFTDTEESSMDSSLLNNALNGGRPKSLNLSDDSDETMSLERVYNLETGTIIEKVGNISREITQRGGSSSSPEGIKYVTVIEEDKGLQAEGTSNGGAVAERGPKIVGQIRRDENYNDLRKDHLDSMIEKGDTRESHGVEGELLVEMLSIGAAVDGKLGDGLVDEISLLEVPYSFKDDVKEDIITEESQPITLPAEDTIVCNNVQYSLDEDNEDIVQKILRNLNVEPSVQTDSTLWRSAITDDEEEGTVKGTAQDDDKREKKEQEQQEFSLEYSTLGYNSGSGYGSLDDKMTDVNGIEREENGEERVGSRSVGEASTASTETEAEISELKDKAIVKKNLDLFSSKGSTEASKTNSVASADDSEDVNGQPSVKELKKLFSSKETKPQKTPTSHLNGQNLKPSHRAVHSLTARSISREIRQELSNGSAHLHSDNPKKSIADTFGNGIYENNNNNTGNSVHSEEEAAVNTKNMIELYEKYHEKVSKPNKRTV